MTGVFSPGRSRPILPAMRCALICLLILSFTVATARAGTTSVSPVTLLGNSEYGRAVIKGIREARRSIVLSFYLFKTGDSRGNIPRKIADELIAARRRGVDVTVYLERKRSRTDRLNDDNHRTGALLTRGGVKVRFDSPNVTTHTKAIVIDSRFVYLGSHNLTQGALRHNNELSVLIDSPELASEIVAFLDRI